MRKLIVVACTFSGLALSNFLQGQGGDPMNVKQIQVDHVQVVADKQFEQVTKAFEQQLGHFDEKEFRAFAEKETPEKAKAKLEAMVGPSGFMLFRTSDHGALLRMAGQKKKAIQYLVGNPLFAIEMTKHDIRASLYAPLRVLIYENDQGKTCIEYDKPSSLFGQFGNERITPTARMLDQKLEALVATAIR
jgi:uncharacterized protein (DUF302 family)